MPQGEAQTRVAYDDSKVGDTMPGNELTWETGDELTVEGYDNNDKLLGTENYSLQTGTGTTQGSFSGKEITGATKYKVTYPATNKGMAQQTQKGTDNTEHLKDYIVLQNEDKDGSGYITDLNNFSLEMKSSIMKFDLSGIHDDVGTLRNLIWTISKGGRSKTIRLDVSGVVFGSGSGGTNTLTAYAGFMPEDMEAEIGDSFTVTLNGAKTYRATVELTGGKTYAPAMRYTAEMGTNPSTWKEVTSDEMKFTIKTTGNNEEFTMPFANDKTALTNLTINWGDATTNTSVASGSSTNDIKHPYATAGNYTITITSSQPDITLQQIPKLSFNNSSSTLISIDTPLLNTAETDFSFCFNFCESLTAISEGLFDKNKAATDFSYCFYECPSLTKIPDGLFKNNAKATDFSNCFEGCTKLTLNSNTFIGGEITKENRFLNMGTLDFRSCFKNAGKDRTGNYGTAPELWDYAYKGDVSLTKTDCFTGVNDQVINYTTAITKGWAQDSPSE